MQSFVPNNLWDALHVIDSHNADVIIKAEGLDESEVNLKSYITLKGISCQHTERHTVWVSVKNQKIKKEIIS